MKKTLSTGILLLIVFLSYSQTIIIKEGFTLSRLSISNDLDPDLGFDSKTKSKVGFTAGVGFNLPISDKFSIQPELNFVQKGVRIESTVIKHFLIDVTYSVNNRMTINYLELPVLAKVSFGSNKNFFLNAGPSIGIGLNGKSEITTTYTYTVNTEPKSESSTALYKVKFGKKPEEDDDNIKYLDNQFDVGIQLGGGVLIAKKVMLDIRYTFGLTNLMDSEKEATEGNVNNKSRNKVLQFTVGLPINLK
jgi:hypothetical protein